MDRPWTSWSVVIVNSLLCSSLESAGMLSRADRKIDWCWRKIVEYGGQDVHHFCSSTVLCPKRQPAPHPLFPSLQKRKNMYQAFTKCEFSSLISIDTNRPAGDNGTVKTENQPTCSCRKTARTGGKRWLAPIYPVNIYLPV